ncbi:MAG: hypothetical protein IJ007_04315 [Oscillospiraceae bacterium]|nr:hypothetical protein [Oscillospiraceae bacterium]
MENKKVCTSSLVLGIIGLVFSFFVPAVTYSCSIPGLAIGVKNRNTHKSSASVALNIIAITIAVINSVCAVLMTLKMFSSKKEDDILQEDIEE